MRPLRRLSRLVFLLFSISACISSANAQIPLSKSGIQPPDAYFQRLRNEPKAFSFGQSYIGLVQKIQTNKALILNASSHGFAMAAMATASLQGGTVVAGVKSVPVVTALFSDMPNPPYDKSVLEKEFFTGPWPTETMSQFYSDMSYQNLTVNGVVLDWQSLSQLAAWYSGDDYYDQFGMKQHCMGLCSGSRIGKLISELLDKNQNINWGQFDNDGPDRRPNSGDDDGYVDFIAIVHPGIGGECGGANNTAIWSHRGQLVNEGGAYTTTSNSAKPGFGKIKVNDYVIVPALACDGVTPNPIGIVAHEFGHAFGLPDLYDVNYTTNGGVGDWDLMATGAWGGDDNSPQLPTQMSAWAKAYLGWIDPLPITTDISDIDLDPIAQSKRAYQIPGDGGKYFLLSNRQKIGTDALLPKAGLVLEIVDPTVLHAGMSANKVNTDPTALGVQIFEANGGKGLTASLTSADAYRQNAGDVFPVSPAQANLDASSNPKSPGNFALCNIRQEGTNIHAQLVFKSTTCGQPQAAVAPPPPPGAPVNPVPQPDATVHLITDSPEKFTGKPIALSGVILNTGQNYFTDLHLSLTDSTGRSIPVQINAPVELPPTQLGKVSTMQPKSISSLLGTSVVATGNIVATTTPGQGKTYIFQVTDVQAKQ